MKPTSLVTLNAIVFVAVGIAFVVYGPMAMAFLNVPELPIDGIAYWHVTAFARMFGAALFGFGFLIWWIGQHMASWSHETIQSAIRTLLLGNGVTTIAAITQQSQVWLVPAGWALTGIFLLFTLAYSFLLIRGSPAEKDQQTLNL